MWHARRLRPKEGNLIKKVAATIRSSSDSNANGEAHYNMQGPAGPFFWILPPLVLSKFRVFCLKLDLANCPNQSYISFTTDSGPAPRVGAES
jgi:hypothetical protein